MAVVDRRAETVMELAKKIVELAQEPLYGKDTPGLGAFLSEAVTEMRYLVHTGTGGGEGRRLLARGAVAMRNGGEISRPGRVVCQAPGHAAGRSGRGAKSPAPAGSCGTTLATPLGSPSRSGRHP